MSEEEYLETFITDYRNQIRDEKEKIQQENIRKGKFTIDEILEAVDKIYQS